MTFADAINQSVHHFLGRDIAVIILTVECNITSTLYPYPPATAKKPVTSIMDGDVKFGSSWFYHFFSFLFLGLGRGAMITDLERGRGGITTDLLFFFIVSFLRCLLPNALLSTSSCRLAERSSFPQSSCPPQYDAVFQYQADQFYLPALHYQRADFFHYH